MLRFGPSTIVGGFISPMKELLAMCVQGTRMNGMYIADNGVTALALPWIKQHFAG